MFILYVFIFILTALPLAADQPKEFITIAILAKDKAHTLPLFLTCIEQQSWPTDKTYLYIRTNNNTDNTTEILKNWINRVGHRYAHIYFNADNVTEPVEIYKQHEWNHTRFKVLGKIRHESLMWAYEHDSDYFVVDCDNFIKNHTLTALKDTNLPIIAPLLHSNCAYSNYHAAVDECGYLKVTPHYYTIINQELKGIIEVPVVHCTYFIRHDILPYLTYDDASGYHEYVIFSNCARKKNISQYIDNRDVYGYITFAEDSEALAQEPWLERLIANLSQQN